MSEGRTRSGPAGPEGAQALCGSGFGRFAAPTSHRQRDSAIGPTAEAFAPPPVPVHREMPAAVDGKESLSLPLQRQNHRSQFDDLRPRPLNQRHRVFQLTLLEDFQLPC